jgi:RNA polymerase sigma factor (sigma-70 family)
MAHGPLAPLLRHIRRLAGASRDAPVPDAQLLARFVGQREEEAFATLMARHGAMVLGVCRRVLGHEQEAEDAFQAAFLVLARKAGSIRRQDALASWLCRVAYHVAVTARARAAKRRVLEQRASTRTRTASPSDSTGQELRLMLDDELNRLPRKYYAPLVLCYLEGKTHEEAARELCWPTGTVKGRLARAREMLRQRLVRRGLVPSAGLVGTLFVEETATAAVPLALTNATLKAALAGAPGKLVAGVVSAEVASLVEGVSQAMFLTRLKIVAAVVLAVSVPMTAVGLVTCQVPAAGQARTGAEPKGEDSKKDAVKNELEKLEGTWTLVSLERRGNLDRRLQKLPDEDLKNWQLVIKGDQWVLTHPRSVDTATVQIDPTKDPKTIDLTFKFRNAKVLTRGIYTLASTTDDDTLTLCRVDQRSSPRPKEFKVPEGGGMLFVWKRASK